MSSRTRPPDLWRLCLFLHLLLPRQFPAVAHTKKDEPSHAVAVAWPPAIDSYGGKKEGGLVFVGLLDGKLAALDKASGATRWTFDSGVPLVSSSADAGPNSPAALRIFPGTDGSLYTYGGNGGKHGIQRVPLSVQDLVQMSPSQTDDFTVVFGRKDSTVYAIDRRSGHLLKKFSGSWPSMERAGLGLESQEDVLLLAREDNSVWSIDMRSGQQLWNVSHATLRCLFQGALFPGKAKGGSELSPDPEVILMPGPDGALRRYNPETGLETWAVFLPSAPVAAFLDGTMRDVLQVQQEPQESDPLPGAKGMGWPATAKALRVSRNNPKNCGVACAAGGLDHSNKVIVGKIGGSHYVMPGNYYLLPEVPSSGEDELSLEESSSLIENLIAQGGRGEKLIALDEDASTGVTDSMTCPIGVHTLEGDIMGMDGIPWLPNQQGLIQPAPLPVRPGQGLVVVAVVGSVATVVLLLALGRMILLWRQQQVQLKQASAFRQEVARLPASAESVKKEGLAVEALATGKKRRKGRGKVKEKHLEEQAPAVLEGIAPMHGSGSGPPSGPGEARNPSNDTSTAMGGGRSISALVRQRQEEPGGIICIGHMRMDSTEILGLGSAGTVVYKGELNGRQVAIKRLLSQFYDLARKELDTLVHSDDHPNVVRCFAMEEDREFVYLALERCSSTLADLAERNPHVLSEPGDSSAGPAPSEKARSIARDVAQGLAALHSRGIVHRDLKPANVLLTACGTAKVSDMGLCKRLMAEQSSFESVGPGGSSGWLAPEQLMQRLPDAGDCRGRQTKALDVFSLGCVLYYCFTGGKHPFGEERFTRDGNIIRGQRNLEHLKHLPLHLHLVACMLAKEPAQRPSMQAVLEHPVWWPPERQLSFLCDLSDRVELLDGDAPPSERPLLISLEAAAQQAIGGSGQWCDAVDGMLLENLGRFRRYSFRSLRDLLRVIRNKNNHFQEMPQELQELMGPLPSGFVAYFTARFPNLVLTAWLWGIRECAGGPPPLDKYFDGASDAWLQAIPEASLPATKRREVPLDAAAPPSSSQLNVDAPAFMLSCPEGHDPSISAPPSSLEPPPPVPVGYPLRPGEKVCSHYQRTGQCNFGEDCIFHHPPFPEVGVVHPVRPHEPICTFYLRTGGCQFGLGCRFHHPPEKAVARNSDGTPVRPGQPVCSQYAHYGRCGNGWFCKYDHKQYASAM